jgi:hypothetical protein
MTAILTARYVLPDHDAEIAAHSHPRFALGLAERALAIRTDPAALARELTAIRDDTAIEMTRHGGDGALLASSAPPPATSTPAGYRCAPRPTGATRSVAVAVRFAERRPGRTLTGRGASDDLVLDGDPIVEAHGGAIAFHSEPEVGSRFWYVLPAAR